MDAQQEDNLKAKLEENTTQFYAFREKYTYYVLAIDAACIGFAVSLTKDAILSWSLIPLAIAVILWMASFYLGIRKLQTFEAIITTKFRMIEAKLVEEYGLRGKHFKTFTNQENKIEYYTKYKMLFFYTGIIIFILWNILNIYLRTNQINLMYNWIKIFSIIAVVFQFCGAFIMYISSPDNTQQGDPTFEDSNRFVKINNYKNRRLKFGFLLLGIGLFISLITTILS